IGKIGALASSIDAITTSDGAIIVAVGYMLGHEFFGFDCRQAVGVVEVFRLGPSASQWERIGIIREDYTSRDAPFLTSNVIAPSVTAQLARAADVDANPRVLPAFDVYIRCWYYSECELNPPGPVTYAPKVVRHRFNPSRMSDPF